ncbi:MAG: methionine biosynthesis protein MetW [Chloroflexota bacterium]
MRTDLHTSDEAHLRPDLQAIADLIPDQTKVLDLGCGDGALLAHLVETHHVQGRGIELSEDGVLTCVRRGLSVRQGNLQEGLADYPDNSFSFVILSQTLPYLDDPAMIIQEMLRVGEQAIVSFPNWGYWRCRFDLLLTGRIPVAVDLPQKWHEAPRRQPLTVKDFSAFCDQVNVRISKQVYLSQGQFMPVERLLLQRLKTLLATTAVFVLESA